MKTGYISLLATAAFLTACANTPAPTAGTMAPAFTPATNVVPGSQEDLVANVGDRVFFDFDQSAMQPAGHETLDRQAEWLGKYAQNNVLIAGNCDERGTEEYNIALGNRRAITASLYLQSRGVAKARISTISYGKDRPTALASTEEAWAQNRNAITSVK